MIPRGRLDIGWRDLGFAIVACCYPANWARIQERVEANAFDGGHNLASLSVRSGFDALLTAMAFPVGSEVLVSALTIRDMVRIIEEHGMVPVPVDLDMDALAVEPAAVERLVGDRTKALLVAHVFGAEMPLDDVANVAHRHGLVLIEDRAQAFVGGRNEGHPESDVVLFSFGPIKTATALGGAILRFRDPTLRARVAAVQAAYPLQSRRRFLTRVVKYAGIKALSTPQIFGLFARLTRMIGKTHDEVISAALRGFPGPELFRQIRHQPSYPLLALMNRRLTTYDRRRIDQRRAAAERLAALLPGWRRPGQAATRHSHWVFPVQHADADRLIRYLWRQGFDATRGASSLHVVDGPAERPASTDRATQTMSELLYLPVSPDLPADRLRGLAEAVRNFEANGRRPADGLDPAGVLAPRAQLQDQQE